MKNIIFLLVFILAVSITGCTKNQSNTLPQQTVSSAPSVTVAVKGISSDVVVVNDIASWEHPVKHVLKENNIVIAKLELSKNKTYPKFYVEFPESLTSDNIDYYKKILNEIASANGFWDYSFVDSKSKINIDVICDKESKSIKRIIVNGDDKLFADRNEESSDDKSDKVIDYLNEIVPEIKQFGDEIEKSSNGSIHLVFRIDNEPNPQSIDMMTQSYYYVYVGEDHPDHTIRWESFYVKDDLSEVLVDDYETGMPITLNQWRENKQLVEKIRDYFISKVPELSTIDTSLDVRSILEVSSDLENPDQKNPDKQYYRIRLNLDDITNTFYWDWFYVGKDFGEIIVADNVNWMDDKMYLLSEWRKQLPDNNLVSFIQKQGVNLNIFSYIVSDDLDFDGNMEYVSMVKDEDMALVIKNDNSTFLNLGLIKSNVVVVNHFDGIHIISLDKSQKKYIFIDLSNDMGGLGFTLYEVKGNTIYNIDERFPEATGEGTRTLEDLNNDGIYERVDYQKISRSSNKEKVSVQYYIWNGESFLPDKQEVKELDY